jgi:hypothetical protein
VLTQFFRDGGVDMLESGDELRFDLKTPDEIGVVGVFGENDLDGDLAVYHGLARSIDRAKGAGANLLMQFIAANRLAAKIAHSAPSLSLSRWRPANDDHPNQKGQTSRGVGHFGFFKRTTAYLPPLIIPPEK